MINDPEIDLTEHRDFQGENNTTSFLTRDGQIEDWLKERLHSSVYGKTSFPWTVKPIYTIYHYDGLVALGNAEERKDAILNSYWGTKDTKYCDCCGRKLNIIPWKKFNGLCKNCTPKEQNQIHIPWM